MKPFLRRISYERFSNGQLRILSNNSIIGPCLNQFPADVREAVANHHFNTPFEFEALLAAGQEGAEMVANVVDDLKCRHAMEYMDVLMPNDVTTIRAMHAFPQLEPHILQSPMAQALKDLLQDGALSTYGLLNPDEDEMER